MTEKDACNTNPFSAEAVSPETIEFNNQIEKLLSKLPPIYTLPPQIVRDAREAGKSIWGPIKRIKEARNRTVSGPAGKVPVRVIIPDTVKGVYLHIHGGGFILGRPYYSDESSDKIAKNCQVAVISVDYRLAPEYPHPAAPDDCEAAAAWLAKNADSEFGTNRIIIGGESAGANLSVVTLLRMRDRHSFTDFSGANLLYGGYDLRLTPSAKRWGDRNLVLTTKLLEWFHHNYASPEKHADPDVSPIQADLSGMPTALFTVGTQDPLLDDTLFMHARWQAAGNRSELALYPGGCHAFDTFPLKIAEQANRRIEEFIAGFLP